MRPVTSLTDGYSSTADDRLPFRRDERTPLRAPPETRRAQKPRRGPAHFEPRARTPMPAPVKRRNHPFPQTGSRTTALCRLSLRTVVGGIQDSLDAGQNLSPARCATARGGKRHQRQSLALEFLQRIGRRPTKARGLGRNFQLTRWIRGDGQCPLMKSTMLPRHRHR